MWGREGGQRQKKQGQGGSRLQNTTGIALPPEPSLPPTCLPHQATLWLRLLSGQSVRPRPPGHPSLSVEICLISMSSLERERLDFF